MSKEKKEEDNNNNNILQEEIELWKTFEYALREENRILFNQMLSECIEREEYAKLSILRESISLSYARSNYIIQMNKILVPVF